MVQSEMCGEVNCTTNFLDIAYIAKKDRDKGRPPKTEFWIKTANNLKSKYASASRFDIIKNSEIDILPLIFKNNCNNIEKQI